MGKVVGKGPERVTVWARNRFQGLAPFHVYLFGRAQVEERIQELCHNCSLPPHDLVQRVVIKTSASRRDHYPALVLITSRGLATKIPSSFKYFVARL